VNRTMMKSKVHRATITGANLEYVGSITLDRTLMELADIREFEQVAVLDIDNGARFETYAMEGGPGDVILNGAAARLVQPGDRVIVITYAIYDEAELASYAPRIVHVDEANRPIDADEAVQQVLDFLNLWANFHFPQLLRALDRIQKDVLQKFGLRSGDYGEYAAKVENRFMAPSLVGLEEYGVPLEVALKLHRYLRPYSTVDDALANLRHLPLEKMNLSGFERTVVEDAQKRL